MMGLPNGHPVQLTFEGLAVNPAWTRDGKEILFISPMGIWRVEPREGAKPKLVMLLQQEAKFPAVGAGNRLAFTKPFADPNIWRQPMAKQGPAEILIASTATEQSAEYSPDGTKIALQSSRSGKNQVWVCSSKGTACVQLTTGSASGGSPRWSPDSSQIAFDSDGEGGYDIYSISASGGVAKRLTYHGQDNAVPSWSKDGRWIYFYSTRSGRNEIWKMSSAGGNEVQVSRNGGLLAMESPDGKYLYYSNGNREGKLLRCLPDGSNEQLILNGILGRSFTVTAGILYFLRRSAEGVNSLHSFEIATGKEELISSIPKPFWNGLSVSPDGKYAIYSQLDNQGADLMMIENFR